MNFIYGLLKGMAMGVGAIAPGVSGGALAVIFGIYERLTDAIAHVFKNFKENVIFFFPIGVGGVIGVLAFSRVINYLFENYNVEVKYLFIGLMVGTIPSVFRHANKRGYKRKYLVPLILTLGVTMIFTVMENSTINVVPDGDPSLVQLLLYGAIVGFGTIIPGISASFILMYLGGYKTLLSAIANIEIAVIIPVGIGFVLSIILFAKLINMLFERAYGYTYYAVIGFVIGSILAIFPGIEFSLKYLFCVLFLIIGFFISFTFSSYEKVK